MSPLEKDKKLHFVKIVSFWSRLINGFSKSVNYNEERRKIY